MMHDYGPIDYLEVDSDFQGAPGSFQPAGGSRGLCFDACVRCGAKVPAFLFLKMPERIAGKAHRDGNNVVILDYDEGFMKDAVMPFMQPHVVAIYCEVCSEGLQMCRLCGCTHECACEGGCAWVEADLCSECYVVGGSS